MPSGSPLSSGQVSGRASTSRHAHAFTSPFASTTGFVNKSSHAPFLYGIVRGRKLDGTMTMVRDGQVAGEKWVVAGEAV